MVGKTNLRTLLAFLWLGVVLGSCGSSRVEPLRVGSPAPEFSLVDLDGTQVDSRSLAGKVVVLNFWATWCSSCRQEIPELEALAAEGGVEVLGIALDQEGAPVVRSFVEQHGISYKVLLGGQEVFERFDGLTIPYTLVLDRSLRVQRIYQGPTSRALVAADLRQLERGA